jgi:hypothetical protein
MVKMVQAEMRTGPAAQVRQAVYLRVTKPVEAQQGLPETRVKVTLEAPSKMEPGASLPVTVSVAPLEVEVRSIKDALSEYGVTVLGASLDAPGFDLSPVDPQESPWVNEQQLTWVWVISPKNSGPQTLKASLKVKGKPEWSAEALEGEIWAGLVPIEVAAAGFNLGQFDWFAPLNTLAGLGLTVPWIYEQTRQRTRKRQAALVAGGGTGAADGPTPEGG